jgi:hypothetical protein
MSATFFGSEIKYTKRYRLGQLLGHPPRASAQRWVNPIGRGTSATWRKPAGARGRTPTGQCSEMPSPAPGCRGPQDSGECRTISGRRPGPTGERMAVKPLFRRAKIIEIALRTVSRALPPAPSCPARAANSPTVGAHRLADGTRLDSGAALAKTRCARGTATAGWSLRATPESGTILLRRESH